MSDAVLVAIIAGIPAILGVFVSLGNGKKSDRLEVKTDEIHAQTNGTLSKLIEELKDARATISRMHKTIETIVPKKKKKPPIRP